MYKLYGTFELHIKSNHPLSDISIKYISLEYGDSRVVLTQKK